VRGGVNSEVNVQRRLRRLCLGPALLAVACGSNGASGGASDASAKDELSNASGGDGAGGSDSGPGSGEGGGTFVDAGPIVAPQPLSPYIVVDQFGYPTSAEKMAIIRSPRTGFDSNASFTPGAKYALVDAHTSQKLLEAAPAAWNGGATDPSSGDVAWSFDFSSVTGPGDYFALDETQNVRSDVFQISDSVYRSVLAQAMRMFYYQRDGIAKTAQYAGAAWADGVAHPQDAQCGLYTDGSAPKDLHGGWFDAGDENKYTNWAAGDSIELLRAYVETPSAFSDDYNIPESGNGVPDILDEAKWELDWIGRMQNADGSVLSIVGHGGASPPSADKSACKYGPANTSAALTSAAAFAYASIVFKSVSSANTVYPGYAANLASMAQKAWTWANANPSVTFYNSSNGVGAGEQEVDAAGRLQKKVEAAVFLFELTGDATYKSFFEGNYAQLQSSFDPFHMDQLDTVLEYTKAPNATAGIVQSIVSNYKSNVEGAGYFGKMQPNVDPYLAYLQAYTWGSNQVKSGQGNMFTNMGVFQVDAAAAATATKYAERYVHYLHGVNPLELVYLSNMGDYGAQKSVTRFFHTWFNHGSQWDAVGVSKYGPPPGYLVGGPNPGYKWDACCPAGCGGAANNAACGSSPPSPPTGQPDQKSYKDFNDNWPLDSWQISEPDDGYQAQYVRLLSKFVK
jgi:endoglucanase